MKVLGGVGTFLKEGSDKKTYLPRPAGGIKNTPHRQLLPVRGVDIPHGSTQTFYSLVVICDGHGVVFVPPVRKKPLSLSLWDAVFSLLRGIAKLVSDPVKRAVIPFWMQWDGYRTSAD